MITIRADATGKRVALAAAVFCLGLAAGFWLRDATIMAVDRRQTREALKVIEAAAERIARERAERER